MTKYTACIACVTILPGGEGIGDIGNSLRQRARKCWPTARYRVDTPPFVMQTHNAARASDPLARDREESDVLRRDHHHHALACGKKNAMT